MPTLTTAQIQALLNQAKADGLDGDELKALEWYLTDRAAELDGAQRLDAALSLLPEAEQQAADTFLVEFAQVQGTILARGAADVAAISDDEWQALIGGD